MQFILLALLSSAAVIIAAPVPQPQAIAPARLMSRNETSAPLGDATSTVEGVLNGLGLPVLGPILSPVTNTVSGLVNTLKGALPVDLISQLKSAIAPVQGTIAGLPFVGGVVAGLLNDKAPSTANASATALPEALGPIQGVLSNVTAVPASLAKEAASVPSLLSSIPSAN